MSFRCLDGRVADPDLFGVCKGDKYFRNLCCITFMFMETLFRAYFQPKKISRRNLAENLLRSEPGSGHKSSGSATLLAGRASRLQAISS
jgi:hypothetical protein